MIIFNCNDISSQYENFFIFGKTFDKILKKQISNIIKCDKSKIIKIAILEEHWEFNDLFYKKNIFLFDLEVIKLEADKIISIIINRNNEVINYYIPFKLLSNDIITEIDVKIKPLNVEEYFSQLN